MLKDNFEFRFCDFNGLDGFVLKTNEYKLEESFTPDLANEIIKVFEKYGVERAYGKFSYENNFLSIKKSRFEGNKEMGGISCSFKADEMFLK